MVIWLLGISGSGKTTLAKALKRYFDKRGIKSFVIDGDYVRDFFDRDLGYSKQERIENIKRVMIAAKVLEENGIVAIVANISPFEELRALARKKFDEYVEVYLKRDLGKITNKESVYSDKNVVGVDLEFEEPKRADVAIDTGVLSVEESLEKIVTEIAQKGIRGSKNDEFDRWNEIKKKTDKVERKITLRPREIYWLKVGQNIGDEIYGKGDNFARPVVVVRRLTYDIFLGIPLTTKIKEGSYFYSFEYLNKERGPMKNSALLLQLRAYSIKRVMNKSGVMSKNDFEDMMEQLKKLLAPIPSKG